MSEARRVKICAIATVPPALVQPWLQHLRDFDVMHPGCHFDVLADAPELSLREMVEALRVEPELPLFEVFARKRKP